MFVADVSLGDLLWSLLVFFFMVIYFMLLFHIVFDLFRNHEMSGVTKALWVIGLLFLPLITMLIYLIVHGDSMAKRSMAQQQQARANMDTYIKSVAATSPTDQITQAKALLDSGAIDQSEFDKLKAHALGGR